MVRWCQGGDTIVSVKEAAKLLNVKRQRVHQLLKAGRLTGARMQVGGFNLWMIDEGSIARQLASKEVGAPEGAQNHRVEAR